ncbi:MAG: CvpA family protein [Thiohalospira sp.]
MIWADYAILLVVAVSAFISVARGFVRESISLAAWVLAFWVALSFAEPLSVWLTGYISLPSARLSVAFLILFITTLILGGLVNNLMGQLVHRTGLTGTDRAVGILFGVGRGVVLAAVLLFLAGLTPLPEDAWWSESLFIDHLEPALHWMRDWLPPDLADHFRFP